MSSNEAQTCTGKDPNGDPCVCRRHAPDPQQDRGEVQRCKNCGHWDTCHPASGGSAFQNILGMYRTQAHGTTPGGIKSSLEEAVKETNSGLRSGQHNERNTSRATGSSRSSFKKSVVPMGGSRRDEEVKIARLVMIPVGLNPLTGSLRHSAAPTNSEISTTYVNQGLAAICDKEGGIVFEVGWNTKKFDELFHRYLPKAMEYLDSVSANKTRDASDTEASEGEYQWCILSKNHRKLTVAFRGSDVTPDSRVRDSVVGVGKNWKDKVLYLASIYRIPAEIYENGWVVPELSESDVKSNQGSDEDRPKISESPRKLSRKRSHAGSTISISSDSESASETTGDGDTKGKGKQKAVAPRRTQKKVKVGEVRSTTPTPAYKGTTPPVSLSGITSTFFDYPASFDEAPKSSTLTGKRSPSLYFPTSVAELFSHAANKHAVVGPSTSRTPATYSTKGKKDMGLQFSDDLGVEDPWN